MAKQFSEAGSSKLQPSDNYSYKRQTSGGHGYQAPNLNTQIRSDLRTGEPILQGGDLGPAEESVYEPRARKQAHPNQVIDKSYE